MLTTDKQDQQNWWKWVRCQRYSVPVKISTSRCVFDSDTPSHRERNKRVEKRIAHDAGRYGPFRNTKSPYTPAQSQILNICDRTLCDIEQKAKDLQVLLEIRRRFYGVHIVQNGLFHATHDFDQHSE